MSVLAALTAAKMQIFHLGNDWQVKFDSTDCSLEIDKHVDGQGVSRVTMFESDKHLLSTGMGDVDDINIMVAGNIDNFPSRKTKSDHMECNEPIVAEGSSKFSVTGKVVVSDTATTDFELEFESVDAHRMAFKAHVKDAHSADLGTNYISMTYGSPVDEEIYGMGLQYSEWDFKGKAIPLISTEAGVGRGLQPVTLALNQAMAGQGGTTLTSYAPAA